MASHEGLDACEAVLAACRLCPRRCAVNRLAGQCGYCGSGTDARIFRYGPHHGEEPPLSGTRGSGTVFFSHCTLSCIYCQNSPWSQQGQGSDYSVAELAGLLRELKEAGCHNWNLVSPTPWRPQIRAALAMLEEDGLSLPVVYNTSGFENPSDVAALCEWVDVFLTDLRYASDATGTAVSGHPRVATTSREALKVMRDRAGPLVLDESGIARSGMMCRLLVLPGHAEEAAANIRWLAEHAGTDVGVSVMSQYMPLYKARGRADEWGREITQTEYARVAEELAAYDFDYAWIQDCAAHAEDELIGETMKAGRSDLLGTAPEA